MYEICRDPKTGIAYIIFLLIIIGIFTSIRQLIFYPTSPPSTSEISESNDSSNHTTPKPITIKDKTLWTICFILTAFFWIFLTGFISSEAEKEDANSTAWGFVAFIMGPLGLILFWLWLKVRPPVVDFSTYESMERKLLKKGIDVIRISSSRIRNIENRLERDIIVKADLAPTPGKREGKFKYSVVAYKNSLTDEIQEWEIDELSKLSREELSRDELYILQKKHFNSKFTESLRKIQSQFESKDIKVERYKA